MIQSHADVPAPIVQVARLACLVEARQMVYLAPGEGDA